MISILDKYQIHILFQLELRGAIAPEIQVPRFARSHY